MRIRAFTFAISLACVALPPSVGLADDDILTVEKNDDVRDMGNGFFDKIHVIIITSHADHISIKEVKFNRGNCGLTYHNLISYPTELKFGDQLRLEPACNVLEATISTDKGDLGFKWEQ